LEFQILLNNLTNPTLLFFVLGIVATRLKSDLEIPGSTSKFISLYLLFSIGFRGGQELSHSTFSSEIVYSLILGLVLASVIPIYVFFLLKRRLTVSNAGAVASAYGSVSAVTFVSAVAFLESQQISYGGHMVAVMALMESPAIIVGVILMILFNKEGNHKCDWRKALHHSFTNGSVLMLMGSLVIGLIANSKQADGIKPFTTDIFYGFLAVFLLEMGMLTARGFTDFKRYGWSVTLFALIVPAVNGCLVAILSGMVTADVGNRFIFAVLAASASYIAVPAAMRIVAPEANPGLYVPMALGVTFPFNITVGIPLYFMIVNYY